MKKSLLRKNQEGFTLIEIIAVLVILGILAAVAIPKYLDMRTDAIKNAAAGATSELNARERLALAQWKLKGGEGIYTVAAAGLDYKLGTDWGGGTDGKAITSPGTVTFKGKIVTFNITTPATTNTPATWTYVVTD